MNYNTYKQLFDEILETEHPAPPYHQETYLNYTKLNRSRMKRWDKLLILDEQLLELLKQITTAQHWIIITEPWCGDAAHIVPFLIRMTEQNHLISYDLQLRDTEPFLIEQYLTKGSRSIPKLIVRDEEGKDLFTWGPRPKGAQSLLDAMKAASQSPDETKTALQNWYNDDKGLSLYQELIREMQAALTAKSVP